MSDCLPLLRTGKERLDEVENDLDNNYNNNENDKNKNK